MFARLLSTPAPVRSVLARRRTLTAAFAVSAAAVALLLAAAPAGAVVTTVEGMTVGVAPRVSNSYLLGGNPRTYANPSGNPVLHGTGVYPIFWDPDDEYWSEWQNGLDTYFHNAGAASGSLKSVFAVDTQYTDKSNVPAVYSQTYKGSYVDYHAYPTSACTDPEPFNPIDQIPLEFGGTPTAVCLTSAQIARELEAFIAQHNLPKGMGNVYYMLTPPGVTVCLDAGGTTGHCSDSLEGSKESYEHSFCSYHAAINPGGSPAGSANTIIYGVIPWTAGGYGNWKLLEVDQTPGWDCQDGGYTPAKHGHGYEQEKAKEKTKKEEEAFKEMDGEEKKEAEEAERLEGPHEQEPNQQTCPSTAGTCDYGLFDLITNQLSLEQEDMVTDPLLNAWQDSNHYENTDECRFAFGPMSGGLAANPGTLAGTLYNQTLNSGNYYLNDAFSLAAYRLPYPGVECLDTVNLDPMFTAPNPVNAGEVVGFDGMESDIALDAGISYSATGTPQANYATYTWNFGDGTPEVSGYAPGSPQCETPWLSPCAASIYHTYQYGGTYEVTLTVRDVGGNISTASHDVTVVGPPQPTSSTPGTATTTGTGGGAGTQTGSSSTGTSTTTVPAPVAAAAILPQSLRKALRKGLVVRYSVNEQVAGRFEVLISAATARHLGISGTPATGMPAGSPPQLVIAKAILVTTKGGHNAVHIVFSKRTAARLAKAHKVALTLRLIVRNSASSNPATTTVISAVTLGG
jgi:hypothetical protein